ncbi:Por secretion system C-terminal sorting domain-containing protein [Nonlabens sp. Hel1_33_55]|uniref:alpha-amylase family glycosyl hydrolase n=1 Tax=Nonlabens sp. Hel1_33_55 TaxID=1336802 RepID=UPI000875BE28|nr:alpha-amylase family glycosyl hydrolase [Nonlabens sp. Hel1_33_55]SCY42728.1 Por secretion system C-terminal sorting domain-containing protein [Nonlabens sp. Hel1_33_55]
MKYITLLLTFLVFAFAKAQVSTASPTPTADQAVTILFDATGTPLEGTTQTLHLYAGVTINGQDFQNTPTGENAFFDNDPTVNPTFTSTGQNSYQITLGPTLNQYFGVNPSTDIITAIDFVIRNANGTNGNNPVQTQDYKLTIFQPGLNAVITTPSDNQIINLNQQITISASSSQNATLDLTVNNTSIANVNDQQNLSVPFTFDTAGTYEIVFTADTGNDVVTDRVQVFVPAATQTEVRPAGLKNGVNENADGSVTFLLAAPAKSSALLISSFTNWRPTLATQLKKDGDYFWVTVPANNFVANEEFLYQYIVDGTIKIADPFSTEILDPITDQFIKAGNYPNLSAYPMGETTGAISLATYLETPYQWNITDFQRPDNENLVIYELLVRDFSEEDSYQAIIDNIDYLTNLGINAVEFMPLNEFGGNDSWGYDPAYHGALDKAYGTPDKFKELVDLLHANGIAVILDVVYNQATGSSPLVKLWPDDSGNGAGPDNPYLNTSAPHRVLEFFEDFNHESPWTKEYVKQTLQYFLDEFNIDGFRFDLSKGFTQTITNGFGDWGARDDSRIAILNDYKSFLLDNNDSDIYLILEHLADFEEERILANNGFMMWGKMTTEYKQNSLGYSDNSNLFRSYFTSRNFDDQHLVSYAESHDEQRIMFETLNFGNPDNSSYNIRSLPIALDRQEALAAVQYSIPGPKMLWQFGELGYDIDIDENGRTGRKPVPFTNGYSTNADRLDLYEITSEMIKLKVKYPETFNNRNNFLELNGGLVKRIELRGSEFDAVVLANFDVTPKQISPKFTQTGTWYDYFGGTSLDVTDQNANINIPAGGYKVFSSRELNTTASTNDNDLSIIDIQLYPNPTRDAFKFNVPMQNVIVRSMTGQTVKTFGSNQERYDVSNLASGIYIVEAYDFKNNRSSIKLVKK